MLLSFYHANKANSSKFPQTLPFPPQAKNRKRKRLQEPDDPHIHATAKPLQKRQRKSEATSGVADNKLNPIDYWRKKGRWPKEYFKQDDQTRKDFKDEFEKDSWFEKYWIPETNMNHLLAQKKSSSSLRRKQSEVGSVTPSTTTPSDQKPRDEKSAPYTNPRYKTVLETKGSFMDEFELGITKQSNDSYQALLSADQPVPRDSLFRGDLFKSTCRKIEDRNETRVIRDISLLIVPSAETLATYGATNLQCLIESTNEGWSNSIPITPTRPQPDYSVGFRRTAFTEDQLKKLQPFTGGLSEKSYFMGTYYMYFPFLTCEVKCGAAALDIADRQNAHSMTIAVRGVVEFYRLVGREKELHREILAFSISHDHSSVRIYGHYPVINGKDTAYYRHPIRKFEFTEQDGKEKWTAYKFTKNVYDRWMPTHFRRICSAINDLPPDINFEVSEQFSVASGLSQVFEDQILSQQSTPDATSLVGNDDSESSLTGPITPNTSLSHGTRQGASFKNSKKRRTVE